MVLGLLLAVPQSASFVQGYLFGADDMATFGALAFCLAYNNLYGVQYANVATANGSAAFMFAAWAGLNHNTGGQTTTTAAFALFAILNFFGAYGQDTRSASGSDSQKLVWYLSSFGWSLDSMKVLATGTASFTSLNGQTATVNRMTALLVLAACGSALRSPNADLGAALKSQRSMFLNYIILVGLVAPILGGSDGLNLDVVSHLKGAANNDQLRAVFANWVVNWFLS